MMLAAGILRARRGWIWRAAQDGVVAGNPSDSGSEGSSDSGNSVRCLRIRLIHGDWRCHVVWSQVVRSPHRGPATSNRDRNPPSSPGRGRRRAVSAGAGLRHGHHLRAVDDLPGHRGEGPVRRHGPADRPHDHVPRYRAVGRIFRLGFQDRAGDDLSGEWSDWRGHHLRAGDDLSGVRSTAHPQVEPKRLAESHLAGSSSLA
jgi:hypothetical protein